MAEKNRGRRSLAQRGTSLLLAAVMAGPMTWSALAQTAPSQVSAAPQTQTQTQTASPAAATPGAAAATPQANPAATPQTSTAPPSAPAPQPKAAPPQGVAIAPYEKDTGVAASRPAGAVIAPGKQRRRRSILIRVGLILGAAAAIGTVVGMSAASSSRP